MIRLTPNDPTVPEAPAMWGLYHLTEFRYLTLGGQGYPNFYPTRDAAKQDLEEYLGWR